MQPPGRMHLVPLQRAMVRIHSAECRILAEVVSAHLTQEALPTRHPRLNSHAVTRLEIRDALTAPDDHARCFVAQDAVSLNDERADAARLPKMDIRPADTRRLDVDETFVRPGAVYGRFDSLEVVVRCYL